MEQDGNTEMTDTFDTTQLGLELLFSVVSAVSVISVFPLFRV